MFKNKDGKAIKILTSFDDGCQLDMQLADMLLKYNIPTVFYIATEYDIYGNLTPDQIRILANSGPEGCLKCKSKKGLFEIGAHTITHPEDLKMLNDEDAMKEIVESKKILEDIIKKSITKFCYPSGRYDDRIKEMVKKAGFLEARTTLSGSIEFPQDPFATRPTVQVSPEKEYEGLTWKEFAELKFEEVLRNGGRFELWGHSYEVENFNMWEFLEDFLDYMNEELKKTKYPRKI